MKHLFLIFVFIVNVLCVNAQKYSVRPIQQHQKSEVVEDSITIKHEYKAGTYLRKSAACDYTGIGLAVLSGVAYSNIIDNRKISNVAGTVLALGAAALKIASITFKSRAGTELRLSAGGIYMKF